MKNNRDKRLWFRVSEEEKAEIERKATSQKSVSTFVRKQLLSKSNSLANPVEFIRVMDEYNREIKKIGNNINQLAKYVNQRKEIPNDTVLAEYNNLMNSYIELSGRIEKAYSKVLIRCIK